MLIAAKLMLYSRFDIRSNKRENAGPQVNNQRHNSIGIVQVGENDEKRFHWRIEICARDVFISKNPQIAGFLLSQVNLIPNVSATMS